MTIFITKASPAGKAVASFLDHPAVGRNAGPAITIAGWFVAPKTFRDIRVSILLRTLDNKRVGNAAVGTRADVQAGILLAEDSAAHGYEARVNSYDLPPAFDLDVRIFFEQDGEQKSALLAHVSGTNAAEASSDPAFAPVYVVGLARSGTTALTRMLGAHSSAVCGDKYPMELCISTFHARLARLAASVADFDGYNKSDVFAETDAVGPNPFASLNHLDRGVLDDVLKASHELFARAAIQATDAWYGGIANLTPDKAPIVFVEKSQPGKALVTALNVYPKARCIILVRDPREGFLSRVRFNRKRGTKDFGEQYARDFNHWAQLHVEEHRALLVDHQALSDRVVQVIRYEDLMENPEAVLTTSCNALGLAPARDVVDRMIALGKDETGRFGEHRTTGEGDDTLRNELGPVLAKIASELSEFFRVYGYAA